MNRPVLSGTRTPVLSGTANPSYQEPKRSLSSARASRIRAPNFPNIESYGFLLTAAFVGDRKSPSLAVVVPLGAVPSPRWRDDPTATQHQLEFWALAAKRRSKPEKAQRQPRRKRNAFSARLTIGNRSDLRARINIAAFERGVTVASTWRLLLPKAFPGTKGGKR